MFSFIVCQPARLRRISYIRVPNRAAIFCHLRSTPIRARRAAVCGGRVEYVRSPARLANLPRRRDCNRQFSAS